MLAAAQQWHIKYKGGNLAPSYDRPIDSYTEENWPEYMCFVNRFRTICCTVIHPRPRICPDDNEKRARLGDIVQALNFVIILRQCHIMLEVQSSLKWDSIALKRLTIFKQIMPWWSLTCTFHFSEKSAQVAISDPFRVNMHSSNDVFCHLLWNSCLIYSGKAKRNSLISWDNGTRSWWRSKNVFCPCWTAASLRNDLNVTCNQ